MLNASLVLQKLAGRKREKQILNKRKISHLNNQYIIQKEEYFYNKFKVKTGFQIVSKIMNFLILIIQILQFIFSFFSKITVINVCLFHGKKHKKNTHKIFSNKKIEDYNINTSKKNIKKHIFNQTQGINYYIYRNIKNMMKNVNDDQNRNKKNNRNKLNIKSKKEDLIDISKKNIKDKLSYIVVKIVFNNNPQIKDIVKIVKEILSVIKSEIVKKQSSSFIIFKITVSPSCSRTFLNFSIINTEECYCFHFGSKSYNKNNF